MYDPINFISSNTDSDSFSRFIKHLTTQLSINSNIISSTGDNSNQRCCQSTVISSVQCEIILINNNFTQKNLMLNVANIFSTKNY